MKFASLTTVRIVAALTAVIFVFVGVVGLLCVGMNMEMGMSMGDCPLMGASTAMCPMKILDHITIWQRLFTAIPSTNTLLLLLTLAVMVGFLILRPHRNDESPPSDFSWWRLYQKTHTAFRLYNFWLRIFASGIVQPKLFAYIF